MLQVLTPLEETRAYQQLVGIGMEKGIQKGWAEGMEEGEKNGRVKLLTKLIRRRFGELPDWATARLQSAEPEQLEYWAEQIFDAETVEQLLGKS